MKYFIYENDNPVEVTENKYHEWEFSDKYNYNFEDYQLVLDEIRISIQVTYLGIFGESEEPKPFVIVYSEKKHGEKEEIRLVEYYKTYEEVTNRRNILKQRIKKEYCSWPVAVALI